MFSINYFSKHKIGLLILSRLFKIMLIHKLIFIKNYSRIIKINNSLVHYLNMPLH